MVQILQNSERRGIIEISFNVNSDMVKFIELIRTLKIFIIRYLYPYCLKRYYFKSDFLSKFFIKILFSRLLFSEKELEYLNKYIRELYEQIKRLDFSNPDHLELAGFATATLCLALLFLPVKDIEREITEIWKNTCSMVKKGKIPSKCLPGVIMACKALGYKIPREVQKDLRKISVFGAYPYRNEALLALGERVSDSYSLACTPYALTSADKYDSFDDIRRVCRAVWGILLRRRD